MPQFEFPGPCGSSNSKGIASGPIIAAVHVHLLNERPRRLAKSPVTKTELVVITIKRKIAAISIPRSPTLSVRPHLCGNPHAYRGFGSLASTSSTISSIGHSLSLRALEAGSLDDGVEFFR